jgi:hydrogenase-4 component E
MINMSEAILVVILLSVLLSLGSTRLTALVKIMALQGVMVSLVPVFIRDYGSLTTGGIVFFQVMIIVKGIIIPGLLFMAVKKIANQA